MQGRRIFRSAVSCLLVVLGSLFVSPPPALAQAPAPAPWSGVAADEAKVPGPYVPGSSDMSPRSLSADGRFVVFHSNLPSLVPNDTNNWNDVFVRDRVTRALTRVSVSTSGVEGDSWSAYPAISADGRHITFYSCASNLVAGDTNGMCDFFVHDRELGVTALVSVGPNGEESTSLGAFYQARLSADGRYIVFPAAFGTGTKSYAWLRDRDTDGNGVFDEPGLSSTTQISTDWIHDMRLESVIDAAISNDARYIAFVSETCDEFYYNCIGYRMYVHDRVTAQSFRVDRPAAGYFDEQAYSFSPDFSDTALLTYSSTQPNLVEGHFNPNGDIYVFNLITGGNVLIDPNLPSLDFKEAPQISADGRYIAFFGRSWNFGNPAYNVYAFDRQTLTTTLVSVHPDGSPDNNTSAPSMTADGSAIAFAAEPGMILDWFGSRGVFVATGVALTPAETAVPEGGGTYTIEVTAPATTTWELAYGPNTIVNPSSGTGSATVTVEVVANTSPDDMTSFINLGSEQARFHQVAPPQIWYTMPYHGPASGGTDVDIVGEGFAEGMTVEFGGIAATSVTFIDSEHIVATTPAHAAGWVTLRVTKASGAYAELFEMFRFDDVTPPIITPVITGTLGANGWYTSDVTVTWTVVDDESSIETEPCQPITQITDVTLVFATCYAWSEGGEAFSEVQIKRDTQPPTVAIAEPQDGHEYNFGQQVPLAVNCADATSGIASCTSNPPGPNLDTTSYLGDHQFTSTAVDAAGHSVTSPVITYSIRYGSTMEVQPASGVYGTSIMLYASLTFDYGTGTGGAGNAHVIFFVDDMPIGIAVTTQGGEASLTLPYAFGFNVGTHTIRAEFAGHASIRPASGTGVLTITKATPVITWPHPADIIQGTPLSETQLNATTTVPGTFVYSPAAGTVLGLGVRQLNVSFTPTDTANYNSATAWEYVWVKAVPVITWFNHAITWPQTLSASVLDATASPSSGSFVYSPPAGTLLDVGTHTLSVTFDPVDQNYITTTKTITLTVVKATPTVTFPATAAIPYGTALSSTQLNATASVPGSFAYTPAAGTVLNAGTHTLSVEFTPTDSAHYSTVTRNKSQTISHLPPTVEWIPPATMTWGTPLGPEQQNATSPLAGTFGYWPEAGTILEVGARELRVNFNPDDPNYSSPTLYRSITVTKATPVITWNEPEPIVYGTSLSGAQLNASANVAGTFTYSPSNGAQLAAGAHTLTATFTPTDSAHYLGSSKQVTLVVSKGTPVVTWNAPAPIVYGTSLSGVQLNASANMPGTFAYSPDAGIILGAGNQSLSVTFTPTDSANNDPATATTSITVTAATPVVTWANPSNIVYGSALSANELNATASVPGTFEYSPALGALLTTGTHALSVTFTPADAVNYTTATAGASITVERATPAIAWTNPAGIQYGTALSSTQLNATANVAGTFTYVPADGAVLNAGTHQLSVTFTPADSANYNAATANASIVVEKATPLVTWANPGGITYGTALSATQLNATANVAGSFAYSPAAGIVLGAGTQNLSVTFTPADGNNYASASANASIEVAKATPVITWSSPAGINYGTALSGTQLNATANVAGSFSYSPAAGSVLDAGAPSLSVTFTPADAANYNGATAGTSIVVAKVALSIQTNNASKVYGQALPAFTVSGTGFVNGDTVASLSGTASFSTAATATSAPGSYSVAPSGLTSANYNITFVSGTLTVTKASTSVALTTTPNPSNNNQQVQLRAVVSAVAPGGGTPTGTVEFRKGTTLLGTATLVNGVATLNKSFKRGTHVLTATYVGSTNFNGSSGNATHQVN